MYNKQYNTRNSGRFNTPGQFVPAGEPQQQQGPYPGTPRPQRHPNQQKQQQPQPQQLHQQQQQQQQQQQEQQQQQQELNQQPTLQDDVPMPSDDVDMKPSLEDLEGGDSKIEDRPAWMKSKLSGVKKISNKEKRRRQNETLRRLLTPKNALMVLNEMMPHAQIANVQFKVEPAQNQYFARNAHSFCADLTLEGNNYKGFGDNKLGARNSAAEQAIRDLIIKKMNKAISSDGGSQNGEETMDEESLPMIQLASFALHKLFTEWECEGHKVPQLKPSSASVSDTASLAGEAAGGDGAMPPPRPKKAKASKAPRTLPLNAAAMHPCMLLTYMRPRLEYRELAADGDKPQNMVFTMGIDVDGATYIGKATNKKEARRAAAKAACESLFEVKFDDGASGTTPVNS